MSSRNDASREGSEGGREADCKCCRCSQREREQRERKKRQRQMQLLQRQQEREMAKEGVRRATWVRQWAREARSEWRGMGSSSTPNCGSAAALHRELPLAASAQPWPPVSLRGAPALSLLLVEQALLRDHAPSALHVARESKATGHRRRCAYACRAQKTKARSQLWPPARKGG